MIKKSFDTVAAEQNWNEDTQLLIIKRFLDEADLYWLLSEYAVTLAETENEQ